MTTKLTKAAQQTTPEPVKFSHAGHFYNLVAHALMEVKRPDVCAHRLRLILDELAVLMGQSTTPTQQAAGEPVAQVSGLFPSVRNKLHSQDFAHSDDRVHVRRRTEGRRPHRC